MAAGEGIYSDEYNNQFVISTGNVFLLCPNSVHAYIQQNNMTIINVLWHFDNLPVNLYDLKEIPGYHALFELEPYARQKLGLKETLVLSDWQLEKAIAIARQIQEEQTQQRPGKYLKVISLFGELMVLLCRAYVSSPSAEDSSMLTVDKVIIYINNHLNYSLRCEDLARQAHVSVKTLNRYFMAYLGQTPAHYILQRRLQRTAEMLDTSTEKLTSIAYECGFADANHLGTVFRRKYGLTPLQYRKKRQENRNDTSRMRS